MELDTTNVWSRYHSIHEFVMRPIQSLVYVVGPTAGVQSEIKEAIDFSVKTFIINQKEREKPQYAKPDYKVSYCELNEYCPRPQMTPQMRESEYGYIRASFFNNFGYYKPAVTIFPFDLRQHFQREVEWNWPNIEQLHISLIRNHQDRW